MIEPSAPSLAKPLQGIKVVEVGQLLAGPFAGTLLAYFGAEVIKVEPPGDGDPIRGWRLLDEQGTSYWWRSLGRNKKSLTLNLRDRQGRELLESTSLSVEAIAERIGFHTATSFRQHFKQRHHVSPRVWRKTFGENA